MKLVSFNINGVRARPHQLEALRERLAPDVIGLQETKVQDPEFPLESMTGLGYQVAFHGQKGHYGVALLSTRPATDLVKGLPDDDAKAQRRLITGVYPDEAGNPVTIINGYFPQGESREHPDKFPAKERFYRELSATLNDRYDPGQALVVMGDLNVAPQDLDIGIGADNARRWLRSGKCSFLPEEREWYQRLLDWGLVDTFRLHHPDSDALSWFDYRSKGFDRDPRRGLRIDFILATRPLAERCTGAGIDLGIRAMEKPSDHAPVWAEFAAS